MFGIPEKQAITLTPKAVGQVLKLMEGKGHAGLRLGVKKGGCAGMEYTMDQILGSLNRLCGLPLLEA